MARIVLSAVVGVAVGYFAGPQAGFTAFSAVYGTTGFLDPSKKVFGPRLQDLKAPQASYGAVIPYVEGSPRLAGDVVWSSIKREIATKQSQGKGGPGVDSTTYTYEIDLLIMLSINQCAGIRKVFSNGKLVWSNSEGATTETLSASAATTAWRDMRFYSGAQDQLPDPTYEAAVGVGNAPAYRGRSTVMIEGLSLGSSGQLPVLTFEMGTGTSVGGGSTLIGYMTRATWYARAGPLFVDASGITMHCLTFAPGDYSNLGVRVQRLNFDGSTTDLISYSHSAATSVGSTTGNVDTPGLLMPSAGSGVMPVEAFDANGVSVRLQLSSTYAGPGWRWSRRGEVDYVSGNLDGTINRFYRGALTAVSSVFSAQPLSIAATPTSLYAVFQASTTIQIFDPVTLASTSTITTPEANLFDTSLVLTNELDELFFVGRAASGKGVFYKYLNDDWILLNSDLGDCRPDDQEIGVTLFERFCVHGDVLYRAVLPGSEDPTGAAIYMAAPAPQVVDTPPTLGDVVSRLCERTGLLTSSDIDVTALASDQVRALAVTQVGPTRATLETLMGAYFFDCAEGDKLKFVKRGGASALTIPYADLGASADGSGEPLPIKRLNDLETPAQVSVKFANVLNDFQDGLETGFRLVTKSTAVSLVDVPLGLTPTEAKQIADVLTMDQAASLVQIGPISLSRKYAALEPSDVITLSDAYGDSFRARVIKVSLTSGLQTLDLLIDDATVITSTTATDAGYVLNTDVVGQSPTMGRELDIPILRDEDDDAGFYEQVKPASTAKAWPGAAVFSSADDVTLTQEALITDAAVFGTCTTTLGDWTGSRVFDEINSVTVNVGDGLLYSTTRSAMLNDHSVNAFAIGVHGRWELGQFRTATLVSPGVYKLTGLLRGSRGTEWAMTGHAASEGFSLLTASGTRRAPVLNALLGTSRYYRAVTIGSPLSSAASDSFVDRGVGVKPFSPIDVRAARTDGDITLTWQRRSRLATRTTGALGISIPLGEATEAYSVDVFTDNTYAVVKRVLNSATTSAVYTSAQQIADFGSNQSTVYVRVYQLSALVGRGTAVQAAA